MCVGTIQCVMGGLAVQRNDASALPLMRHYPNIKFIPFLRIRGIHNNNPYAVLISRFVDSRYIFVDLAIPLRLDTLLSWSWWVLDRSPSQRAGSTQSTDR